MAIAPGSRTDRAYHVAVNSQPWVWQDRLTTLYAVIPTKPVKQDDWPNPNNQVSATYQTAIRSQENVWQNRLSLTAAVVPFAQDDWPLPGNEIAARYRIALNSQLNVWQNLQGTLFVPIPLKPFLQSDWPNPLTNLAARNLIAGLAQPSVWQNPQLTVFFPVPLKPFNQTDWPNPWGRPSQVPYSSASNAWANRLPITPTGTPFAQDDWPNPLNNLAVRHYIAATAWTWADRQLTLFVAVPSKPFLQTDWPLPLNNLTTRHLIARSSEAGVWSNPLLGPIFPTLTIQSIPYRIFDEYPPHLLLVDCSVGTITNHIVTLPSIAVDGVRHYWIKRTDNTPTRTLTIQAALGDTIEGASTLLLPDQYDSVELISDRVNRWMIVASRGI